MSTQADNYLWDPKDSPDAEIEALERQLRPLSADSLKLQERVIPIRRRKRPFQTRALIGIFSAAAAAASLYFAHLYRLNWEENSPWPMQTVGLASHDRPELLHVGERIVTAPGQSVTLNAARIGTVTVSPESTIRLTQTQKGRHRLELEHGRMHAKVWAPPSYFGVTHGDTRIIDMGCEFDLSIDPVGKGSISVTSGWVIFWIQDKGVFVPEQYVLEFDASKSQLPTRADADAAFRSLANELDAKLAANESIDDPRVVELGQSIASSARDEDYFTLLTLLDRYPALARSLLYPRLAVALKVNANDEAHRALWATGDVKAKNEWWNKLPTQPKQSNAWWWNWRDAF